MSSVIWSKALQISWYFRCKMKDEKLLYRVYEKLNKELRNRDTE